MRRGELDAARTLADQGVTLARSRPDSQWARRFTLLLTEVLIRKHDLPEAHRVIAYWNRYVCDANQASINRLIRCFRWACVALIPAVVLWSSSLALN